MTCESGLGKHVDEMNKTAVFAIEEEFSKKDAAEEQRGKAKRCKCWSARYSLALLAFLGFATQYSQRVILSIAIVAMAGTSGRHSEDDSENACPGRGNTTYSGGGGTLGQEAEFDWDESTQGLILGAFFYGFTCTNLLGGRAAEHLGGKLIFGLGAVASAFVSLLSPLCARTSTGLFMAAMVLMGALQGISFPAMFPLMAAWFTPEERAKFGSIVFGGTQFGAAVTLPLSGCLIASGFLGGWPSVFYVFGALGVLWGVPWFLLVHDRPERHPRISREELAFIQAHQDTVKKAEIVPIPWKSILTSGPVWGCILGTFGGNFAFLTLLMEIPTYLANIQHISLNSSGALSAAPCACMWSVGLAWGFLMDKLTARGVLSIKGVRRLSTASAAYILTAAMIAMCFVDCDATAALAVMCIAMGAAGMTYSGHLVSNQDIAPNLAGTLGGIINTIAGPAGFIAPALVGVITKGQQSSIAAWRIVFIITAVSCVVFGTSYLLLMSAEVQPWNEPKKDEKDANRSEETSAD